MYNFFIYESYLDNLPHLIENQDNMKNKFIFISINLNTAYFTLFCSRVVRTILISLIYDLDIFANDANTQYFFVIVVVKKKLHPQLSVSVYLLV